MFHFYQKMLKTYPILMQSVQTGILMGTGDIIAQIYTEQQRFPQFDFYRTRNFFVTGFFIVGPSIRVWYGILNNVIGNKTKLSVVKKVVIDQVFFAPCLIAVLLSCLKKLENWENDAIYEHLKENYMDLLRSNYMLWPWVQLCNFSFVPLNYQPLFVQTVALFWNVYFSWKTNKHLRSEDNIY